MEIGKQLSQSDFLFLRKGDVIKVQTLWNGENNPNDVRELTIESNDINNGLLFLSFIIEGEKYQMTKPIDYSIGSNHYMREDGTIWRGSESFQGYYVDRFILIKISKDTLVSNPFNGVRY